MITTCGLIIKSMDQYLVCLPTGNSDEDNQWDIPKGEKIENESDLETAYREAKEEIGINLLEVEGDLSYLGKFKYYGRPKELVAFLLEAEEDMTGYSLQCLSCIEQGPNKGMPEFSDFRWVSIDQAMAMVHKTVAKAFKKVADYS